MPIQYQEITVDSWPDAKRLLSVDKAGWAWRGHQDANWSFTSSLERAITLPSIKRSSVEQVLFQRFARRAHHYLEEELPELDNYLHWFSIMQHYGAPTRVLDWTYSPYIAAFFSLESASNPASSSAVWAIDLHWCRQQATKVLRDLLSEPNLRVPGHNIWEPAEFKRFFIDHSLDFVAPVEPFSMNERLTLQQGLFLCQGNLSKSFEENLGAYEDQENHILKFILPNKVRAQALIDLDSMGLSRATLFPGIDGFAQSLRLVIIQMEDPDLGRRVRDLATETRKYITTNP